MCCCTMEEEDLSMLSQKSGDDGSGSNQMTTTTDDHSVLLAFLAYLSFGFRVISTVIVVLMAGWIIITIKTARSLHTTHNIYVAYLLAMDTMYVITITLPSAAMMMGYVTGMGLTAMF